VPSSLTLLFEAEIVEKQRLLDGAEQVWLEGRADLSAGTWLLSMSYVRPKEAESALDEGDLALDAGSGTIQAALESGHVGAITDDVAGDERDVLKLVFRVEDGDGDFEGSQGLIRVEGAVSGAMARFEATLELDRSSTDHSCA
jgi:hypothetical protein